MGAVWRGGVLLAAPRGVAGWSVYGENREIPTSWDLRHERNGLAVLRCVDFLVHRIGGTRTGR